MKTQILLLINLLVLTFCTMAQLQHENKPAFSDTLFFEDWSSGSFATNQWIVNPSDPYILKVTNFEGNPVPSVEFSLYEFVPCTITSKEIAGTNKYTELRYDISVFPHSNATFFSSAEIYDGNIWHSIDVISGNGDMVPWNTRVVNISGYCQNNFNIRFTSTGQDDSTGHLNIDNIIIGSFSLGIAENNNTDLIISPNPARGSIRLEIKNFENQKTQLIITDIDGKEVYREEFIPGTTEFMKSVNVNSLPAGIYFCRIKSAKTDLIRKVILE